MAIPTSHSQSMELRDWSLIMGRCVCVWGGGGGATKREGGGACEVLPYKNRGGEGVAEKVLALLKGGTRGFGVVFTQ